MNIDDGSFLSLATLVLGFWLLVFLFVGGLVIYLWATKYDQDLKEKNKNSSSDQ